MGWNSFQTPVSRTGVTAASASTDIRGYGNRLMKFVPLSEAA